MQLYLGLTSPGNDADQVMMVLQNPANTVIWLLSSIQVLVAPTTLLINTISFTTVSKAVLVLQLFYTVLILLGIALGPVHGANALHLYVLPQSFRLQLLGYYAIGAVAMLVLMTITRLLLKHRQKRRIAPV